MKKDLKSSDMNPMFKLDLRSFPEYSEGLVFRDMKEEAVEDERPSKPSAEKRLTRFLELTHFNRSEYEPIKSFPVMTARPEFKIPIHQKTMDRDLGEYARLVAARVGAQLREDAWGGPQGQVVGGERLGLGKIAFARDGTYRPEESLERLGAGWGALARDSPLGWRTSDFQTKYPLDQGIVAEIGHTLNETRRAIAMIMELNPHAHSTVQDARVVDMALKIVKYAPYVAAEARTIFAQNPYSLVKPERFAKSRYDDVAAHDLSRTLSVTAGILGRSFLGKEGTPIKHIPAALKEQVDKVNLCYFQVYDMVKTGSVRDAYVDGVGNALQAKAQKHREL